jgi:hypothetical protein
MVFLVVFIYALLNAAERLKVNAQRTKYAYVLVIHLRNEKQNFRKYLRMTVRNQNNREEYQNPLIFRTACYRLFRMLLSLLQNLERLKCKKKSTEITRTYCFV